MGPTKFSNGLKDNFHKFILLLTKTVIYDQFSPVTLCIKSFQKLTVLEKNLDEWICHLLGAVDFEWGLQKFLKG